MTTLQITDTIFILKIGCLGVGKGTPQGHTAKRLGVGIIPVTSDIYRTDKQSLDVLTSPKPLESNKNENLIQL